MIRQANMSRIFTNKNVLILGTYLWGQKKSPRYSADAFADELV
jgi:hypothetical protein